MTARLSVQEKLRRLTVKVLSKKENPLTPEQVTKEANFIHDLGANSLNIVTFFLRVEDRFGINIENEESLKFQHAGSSEEGTFGQLLELVEAKLKAK